MSTELQKWADDAMFRAEPLKASDGPHVYLLFATPDPLGAVAAMSKMYKGQVVRSASDVTDYEREMYLGEILKTKLKAPLEAVKLHFMVEGVTRSLTHQMVRQRTAVYAQESLRFAVKEDMADGVALPPSLAGTVDIEHADRDGRETNRQRMRYIWDDTVQCISDAYNELINMGMPAEDARGLLPHNITTRLNYVTDLRALQDHAGNRLCTQAQFEWRGLWAGQHGFIAAIHDYCSSPEHKDGTFEHHEEYCDNWQWQAIANIFRPVCYLTGKCEFRADFDRPCKIRDRVDAFHEHGVSSVDWDTQLATDDGRMLLPISASEWLLDPSAARG